MGWEPQIETLYEYDGAGRLVRSVEIRESEWRPEDVALLVASKQHEREYGPHGILMSEAMDPDNQFAFEGYEKPRVDWAEKTRKDAEDNYYKRWDPDGKLNKHGHIWGVSKRQA